MLKKMIIPTLVTGAALAAGCNTTPTQDGALLGGALGAGLGAIVGNQSGHAGEGALIGAGAGALTGAIVGDQVDEARQSRYPQNRHTYRRSSAAPRVEQGHYDVRIVRTPSGETYEERVWVPYN